MKKKYNVDKNYNVDYKTSTEETEIDIAKKQIKKLTFFTIFVIIIAYIYMLVLIVNYFNNYYDIQEQLAQLEDKMGEIICYQENMGTYAYTIFTTTNLAVIECEFGAIKYKYNEVK